MLSRNISAELIPQRLAAIAIENEFEKLKDTEFETDIKEVGFTEILGAEFFNLWVNQRNNPDIQDLKENIACIGAIALRWLTDLHIEIYGEDK